MIDVKIPEIGENIESGTVVSVAVKEGDAVTEGQDLLELETDKATVPIPSPGEGVVKEILIKQGDQVKVGSTIMRLEGEKSSSSSDKTPKEKPQTKEEPQTQETEKPQQAQEEAPKEERKSRSAAKPQKSNQEKSVVIVGGGPGGYAAAFLAADLGLNVTLVDKDVNPGGVCLYRGCIPSKALLHAAKVLSESREAKNFGINFGKPKIDLDKLRGWKNDVVQKLTGGLGILAKQRKIKYIQGTASFIDSNTVKVKTHDNKDETLTFDNAVIATGSHPIALPGTPESERIWDSTSALEIKEVPKSLLLVGGGYIGLELGIVYAELGSEVSVVEMLPQLMTGADRDVAGVLEKRLKTIMKDIMVSTKVTKMEETKSGVNVTFENKDGKTNSKEYEKVLVAIGRRPNTKNIGLENTEVKVNDQGFIEVDGARRTSDPSIYAIGDVTGNPMLAHKASHEGRVAVEAIAGHKVAFEPAAIPAVVFTDPEIAWCGLTETEAKEKGITVEVTKFPWGASGRAITLDRTDGLTKLLIDPETERILGVSIVGPNAGEMIAEGVLAIEMGAVASDMKLTIHPHPTLTETLMESAEIFFGQSTHIYKPKRK